jgi:nicotinate-nucleotide adenylyltransferase
VRAALRVGLLGGSFDPIHAGHRACALAALRALALDRVDFLPTAVPPHKPERRFAPALARYAMTELALLDDPRLRVATDELTPGVPAYAIDTVERRRAQFPREEVVLLIGADSLAAFDGWRGWRDLLTTVEIGVFTRPGFAWSEVEPQLPAELAAAVRAARVRWIDAVRHPASASEIRRRLAADEPIPDGWLDPRVLAFVEKYSLYR